MDQSGGHQSRAEEESPALVGAGQGLISGRIATQQRSARLLMLVVRLIFLVLLAGVTTLTIGSQQANADASAFSTTTVVAIVISTLAVGIIVLGVDYMTPNKRLASTVAVYLGICVGLLGALAVAKLIDVVAQAWGLFDSPDAGAANQPNPFIELAKVVVGIILCYLSVSFVLNTKDDFRLVIPYVEFAKQVRGVRPLVLDTSVLIDGRIQAIVDSGFIDAPLVIPMFVVEELQELSDSSDRLKRARGRRGLDMVAKLQSDGQVDVSVEDFDVPGHSVDHKLVDLAGIHQMRILTTDQNLVKVAKINATSALNVNDLAAGLKAGMVPGERLAVELVKPGENEGQGVGYLPDGTMIVVEGAADRVGQTVETVVTNSLQTSAGRMIFARVESDEPGSPPENGEPSSAPSVRRTRTSTPSGRNPRR